MWRTPSSTLKTPLGSLSFPVEGSQVYQPSRFLPLNRGIQPVSLVAGGDCGGHAMTFESDAMDRTSSRQTFSDRSRAPISHDLAWPVPGSYVAVIFFPRGRGSMRESNT